MTKLIPATITLCLTLLVPTDGRTSSGGEEDQQTTVAPERQPATRQAQPKTVYTMPFVAGGFKSAATAGRAR